MKNSKCLFLAAFSAFIVMAPALSRADSTEDGLRARLLEYYAAITSADINFIDNITSQHPEVTLLGSDPTEFFVGHANIIQFWQDLFDALGGGLVTVPGAGSPDVITRKDGVAWLVDIQSKWVLPEGDLPFRLTAVFKREHHQWKLIQQHFSLGVPN